MLSKFCANQSRKEPEDCSFWKSPKQLRNIGSSASGTPTKYCLCMGCQSVSVNPLLHSASSTASASACRANSSSLPSLSSSPSSFSPLLPPCWCCTVGQSGSAAAADGPDCGTKSRARMTPTTTTALLTLHAHHTRMQPTWPSLAHKLLSA